MKLPRHQIATALAARSLGTLDVKAFSEEIAAYLLSERRTGELDSLLRDIMQYRADNGVVEVIAVSAFPLSAAARADITKQVKDLYPKATQVMITEQHDESVVAGVRLEFANQQLDLSIRNKLNRLKQLTAAGKEF